VLVEHQSDVNTYNTEIQGCPLNTAVNNGDLQTAHVLLNAKCDVNCLEERGVTPLYKASEIGLLKFVKVLLEHGADPDIETTDLGNISLFAALEHSVVAAYLIGEDKPIQKICAALIQAGSNVDHENLAGQTPFQAALDSHQCKVALMLLESDCSLHSDCWLTAEMDVYIISLENDCPDLYVQFLNKLKNPLSLRSICRNLFRDLLTIKWPYKQQVENLPLPKPLRNYLTFDHILDVIE